MSSVVYKCFMCNCFLLIVLSLFSCNQVNYQIEGKCLVNQMPKNRKIEMRKLSIDGDGKFLQSTSVSDNGQFKLNGYIDKPEIVYFVSGVDDKERIYIHGMCILEPGKIKVDCTEYQINRTFFDCVGTGTLLNDEIQNFYKLCSGVNTMDFNSYEQLILFYMKKNSCNCAGTFLACDYLYHGGDFYCLPDSLKNIPLISDYHSSLMQK